MNLWLPVDKLADWLADRLGPRNQLRLGIMLFLASVPLYCYVPFTSEPPIIYVMSALALSLTGVGIIISAEVLLNQEEDKE